MPTFRLSLLWFILACGCSADVPQSSIPADASPSPPFSPEQLTPETPPEPLYAGKTLAEWQAQLKQFGPGVGAAEAAIPQLTELAASSETPVVLRRQVVMMLGRLGEPAAVALPIMLKLLDEAPAGDDAPAAWAAKAIALWGPEAADAVPELTTTFRRDDATWETKLAVMEAMSKIGTANPQTIRFLVEILRSPPASETPEQQRELKMAAADGLTLIGPQAAAAVPALITNLDHPHEFVRARCAIALGIIGPGTAHPVPALADHLVYDTEVEVRKQSAIALGRIGEPAQETLLVLAEDEATDVRRLATTALREIVRPTDDVVDTLLSRLGDPADEVRIEAASSAVVQQRHRQEVIPALLQLLTSSDRTVRVQAAKILTDLNPTESEWHSGPEEFRIDRNQAAQQLRDRIRLTSPNLP